jgi:hypothetical protein
VSGQSCFASLIRRFSSYQLDIDNESFCAWHPGAGERILLAPRLPPIEGVVHRPPKSSSRPISARTRSSRAERVVASHLDERQSTPSCRVQSTRPRSLPGSPKSHGADSSPRILHVKAIAALASAALPVGRKVPILAARSSSEHYGNVTFRLRRSCPRSNVTGRRPTPNNAS